MKRIYLVWLLLISVNAWSADVLRVRYLDTTGAYSEAVYMKRDLTGNMVFRDKYHAEISLSELSGISGSYVHQIPDVYEVDPTGARGYDTVTSAAIAATAAGGGVIYVWPGTYDGIVTLGSGVHLYGVTGRSEQTLLEAPSTGSAVVIAEGGNYISGVTIRNTAASSTANSAILLSGTGFSTLKLERVTLLHSAGWGLLRCDDDNDAMTIRDCDFVGGARQIWTMGTLSATNCFFLRIDSTTSETITIRSTTKAMGVYDCVINGSEVSHRVFRFESAGGALYAQGLILLDGAEGDLFQADTASGSVQYAGVNATGVGAAGVTGTRFERMPETYGGQSIFRPSTSDPGVLVYKKSGAESGRFVEGQDSDTTVRFYVGPDGYFWPNYGSPNVRACLTAGGAVASIVTKQLRSNSGGAEFYELEYDDSTTMTACWTFLAEDYDVTTDTAYITLFFEVEDSAATQGWSFGSCTYTSGSAVNQTLVWDTGKTVANCTADVMLQSSEIAWQYPTWPITEDGMCTFALRNEATGGAGIVNVFRVRVRWGR